ncbi:MAG: hypothetical protein ABSG78_01840 [Verrucomicrobiota bacterium]
MAKAKSSASPPKGCRLYPISERGDRHFEIDDEEIPVSIDTYKMLVEVVSLAKLMRSWLI